MVNTLQAPIDTGFSDDELAEARRYPLVIYWSEANDVYLVSLPDFAGATRHGDSYGEAAEKGLELVAELIDLARRDGDVIPAPGTTRAFVIR